MVDQVVGFNENDLRNLNALLSDMPNAIGVRITNRVLNSAAIFSRAESARRVNAEVNLSQRDIRKFSRVTRSNFANLTSRMTISGQPIPLILYKPSQTRRGTTVRVRKTGAREIFRNAFIAALPRQRINSNRSVTLLGGTAKLAVMARQYLPGINRRVGRLPIFEHFGPSVPAVFEHNGLEITVTMSGDRLQDDAVREIESYFRGFA